MRLALAQINPLVGDLQGNAERILVAASEAQRDGADVLLTPELSLWGYPPRDLLLQPDRIAAQAELLQWISQQLDSDLMLLVGVALQARPQSSTALTSR